MENDASSDAMIVLGGQGKGFCIGLVGILYTKILCYAKEGRIRS
jgi:hypothetical protein